MKEKAFGYIDEILDFTKKNSIILMNIVTA